MKFIPSKLIRQLLTETMMKGFLEKLGSQHSLEVTKFELKSHIRRIIIKIKFLFLFKIFAAYKMEMLKLKEFNFDKLKAVISKKVKYDEREFTSVKFSYDGSDVPAIRVDGSFKLFEFNSDGKIAYSLAINCENDEDFFQELCKVLPKESSKVTNKKQNFEQVKETKSGNKVVYGKIYTKSNGKVKCRISLNSIKNLISIEKLVDESFTGSCILKLYHCYIGETNSISLSVQEIFAKKLERMESYSDESESDNE